MSNLPSRRPSAVAARVTRRHALGILLAGTTSLIAACGRPAATAGNESAFVESASAPALVPGAPAAPPGSAPAPAKSSSSDVLVAVQTPAIDSTNPTGAAAVAVPSTPEATATVAATSTVAPTATATVPPTATATAIPYVASRLTALLGQSVTSYAGSIPSRAHNVQLATRKINGAKVPPGGTFSFDDTVGDQTEAGGFQQAYGIINNNGVPETVKADAGGICQVATTLFQAVFWAGLPIVMHYHHLYWIAHYGEAPYGMTGLDATVDFPPVDFQFRNNTSDWIRVDASYDSTRVHMRIAGVDQEWKVTASQPKIDNLLKVDRGVVLRPDPTMKAGTELWIESAQDGFDVTIERTVTKGSQTVDHYVYTNHYEPAHNVKLVGTLGATPTAVTTATPSTTPASSSSTPTPPPPAATSTRPAAALVKVPSLLGLPEAQARQLVANAGLQNTFTNYQGPGDVPATALSSVAVGSVLSQIPPVGTAVAVGTTVYLAVRKA